MFDNACVKVRKVDRPSIWIRGRLERFEDSVHFVHNYVILRRGTLSNALAIFSWGPAMLVVMIF